MTSDEIAVLANPLAGHGRHRELISGAVRRLGTTGRAVRVLTAGSGAEAERVCHEAVAGGAAALIAVGGDGTVHRALQAVAGTGCALGVVPAGTGNDFAAGVGVRESGFAALEAIAAALAGSATEAFSAAGGAERPGDEDGEHQRQPGDRPGEWRVDLALMEGVGGERRWFGAVLAAGFDAVVNERANRMKWPRGPRRYDVAIALEMARLRARPYTIELDGVDHGGESVLVAVGNCASYGGGMRILPGADPADGLLDVLIAAPLGRAAMVRLKPRLRGGTHVTDARVRTFRARRVRVDAAGIVAYADGERVGPLPLDIRCVPGAVRLLGRPRGQFPVSGPN